MRRELKTAMILLACVLMATLSANTQTQFEMNVDAGKKADAADKKLNATYQQVIKKYKTNAVFIHNLGTAQKDWVVFRDAYLESIFPAADKQIEYGSMYPLSYSESQETVTRTRTHQLERFLYPTRSTASPELSFRTEEKLLNDTYQTVLKSYDSKYLNVLRQAEIAWLDFRDADADAFSSLMPALNKRNARQAWQSKLDHQRTKELHQLTEDAK